MRFADENLRDSMATVGARQHFLTPAWLAGNVYFDERHLFRSQKPFGRMTKTTKGRGVDFNSFQGLAP